MTRVILDAGPTVPSRRAPGPGAASRPNRRGEATRARQVTRDRGPPAGPGNLERRRPSSTKSRRAPWSRGCAGSRCSPGATSTTPRPAGPSVTPTTWRRFGPTPASTSPCAPRWPAVTRPDRARRVPRAAQGQALQRLPPQRAERAWWAGGRPDGLVEIWNGMPFFSPLWARCPRIIFLHHVHAEMWQMVLRPWHARGRGFRGAAGGAAAVPGHTRRHPVGIVAPGDRVHARSPQLAGERGPSRDRRPVRAGGLAFAEPNGGRRRPTGPGQALRPAHRRAGARAPLGSRPAGRDRGGGIRTGQARGPSPGRRRRRMARAPRVQRGQGAPRRLPPRMGVGQHLAARGMGHDDQRGRGVCHPRRGVAHRGARRRRRGPGERCGGRRRHR